MKKLSSLVPAILALSLLASADARAGVLYDNGAPVGDDAVPLVPLVLAVTNSFDLLVDSTLTGIQFGLWASTGEEPALIALGLGTTPFSSDLAFAITALTNVFLFNNGDADIYQSTVPLVGTLPAGTYWVTLYGGVDTDGEILGWDITDGPSLAGVSVFGFIRQIPSESFQILGDPVVTAPEPASFTVWGLGMIGLVAAFRRHRKQAA